MNEKKKTAMYVLNSIELIRKNIISLNNELIFMSRKNAPCERRTSPRQ